ncbi:MAG TPA: SGNH/GDSL hydrolase family protein [Gemmatimonadaceae bacterium]|nr:SGNH/GDSL hydrolase family protein [Gemmatimonadaceae bacterium]
MRVVRITACGLFGLLSGCADLSSGPNADAADMNRYVAMGSSVSMGVMSDGIVAESQRSAWPALLAADVGAEFGLPLIDAPGCRAPLAAPLANFRRTDNTLLTDTGTCAPNVAGFTLPEQNVSLNGATASAAVNFTPANSGNPLYSRVLGNGQTQLLAMTSMSPSFVSVELGSNELLPALSGLVSDASTGNFAASYTSIVTAVKQRTTKALLVLLPTDMKKFPAIRTAAEIASQRAAFAGRNVTVHTNCDTATTYVALTTKVLPIVATAAVRASSGLGPVELSCANVANARDGILTEADMTTLNAAAAQINTFITNRANENGYATFSLGVLYDVAKDGVPFNINTILTSATPFGNLISLDATHPSAAGQAVLASAAKAAIIQKYGTIVH